MRQASLTVGCWPLAVGFLLLAVGGSAQVTKINPVKLVAPSTTVSRLLVTDAGGAVAWSNAQSLLSAGTGISISGNTIANTLPDQTVVLSQSGIVTVSGAYPNFTLGGTVTTSGFLQGNGTSGSAVRFISGSANGQVPMWNAGTSAWELATPGGVSGSGAATQVAFWDGTTVLSGENNLWWDKTNDRLGIGTSGPDAKAEIIAPAATNGLLVNYTGQVGQSQTPLSVRRPGGMKTFELGANVTQNEGILYLRAPSGQGAGTGIDFTSNADASAKQALFQLDGAGNMVFRALHSSMYFDAPATGARTYFRRTGYALAAQITDTGLFGINCDPSEYFDVDGKARVRNLTAVPTTLVGSTSTGVLGNLSLGSGLSITSGTLNLSGGTLSGLTSPRVPFATSSTTLGDDAELFWDNTNKRLAIGPAVSPVASLHLAKGTVSAWEPLRAAGTVSGNMIISLLNINNAGGASNTLLDISVGGANGGDPAVRWLVNGVGTWSAGVDNSDADKFQIAYQTLPGNGAPGINIETNGRVAIGGNAANADLSVYGILGIEFPNGSTANRPTTTGLFMRGNSTVNGIEFKSQTTWHRIVSKATPTATVQSPAGVGASISITGNDLCGQITVNTGTSTTTGVFATVTFNQAHDPALFTWVQITPSNDQAVADFARWRLNSGGNTSFNLRAISALTTSTSYTFNYSVRQ